MKLILFLSTTILLLSTNVTAKTTRYQKDSYGNITLRIECYQSQNRCEYYNGNGMYIGKAEKRGNTIYYYDQFGNLTGQESASY